MSQIVFDEDEFEKRNKENYQQHVALNEGSMTGIKQDSCLNSLEYFHVTENVCVDIMHDVLEGVAPLEVKLLLRQYIYEEKLLSLEQLNDRMMSFDYGYSNDKNKPSVILNLKTSETAVRQTAAQMWCLLQILPFLLGDLVNPGSLHWQLFILLREICNIIFAPTVSTGLAVYLKQLIIDHHKLFKELYPGKNLIPKHHFMVHYPSMLVQFGPLSRLWCMRFEAKHNPLKRQAHVVCNFKNVSKTLAYKNQVQQMHCWRFGQPLDNQMCVPNAFPVILRSLPKSDQLIDILRLKLNHFSETMSISHTVSVWGQTYRTGTLVVIEKKCNELVFGEIVHLFPQVDNGTLLAFVNVVHVDFFDDHFYAFCVEKSEDFNVVKIPDDLLDFRPLDFQKPFQGNKVYVCPRYEVI